MALLKVEKPKDFALLSCLLIKNLNWSFIVLKNLDPHVVKLRNDLQFDVSGPSPWLPHLLYVVFEAETVCDKRPKMISFDIHVVADKFSDLIMVVFYLELIRDATENAVSV